MRHNCRPDAREKVQQSIIHLLMPRSQLVDLLLQGRRVRSAQHAPSFLELPQEKIELVLHFRRLLQEPLQRRRLRILAVEDNRGFRHVSAFYPSHICEVCQVTEQLGALTTEQKVADVHLFAQPARPTTHRTTSTAP